MFDATHSFQFRVNCRYAFDAFVIARELFLELAFRIRTVRRVGNEKSKAFLFGYSGEDKAHAASETRGTFAFFATFKFEVKMMLPILIEFRLIYHFMTGRNPIYSSHFA